MCCPLGHLSTTEKKQWAINLLSLSGLASGRWCLVCSHVSSFNYRRSVVPHPKASDSLSVLPSFICQKRVVFLVMSLGFFLKDLSWLRMKGIRLLQLISHFFYNLPSCKYLLFHCWSFADFTIGFTALFLHSSTILVPLYSSFHVFYNRICAPKCATKIIVNLNMI